MPLRKRAGHRLVARAHNGAGLFQAPVRCLNEIILIRNLEPWLLIHTTERTSIGRVFQQLARRRPNLVSGFASLLHRLNHVQGLERARLALRGEGFRATATTKNAEVNCACRRPGQNPRHVPHQPRPRNAHRVAGHLLKHLWLHL